MSSVTYKNQTAIDKTGGSVPVAGTEIPYRVTKLLWPDSVEEVINSLLEGYALHVCSGMSQLGNVRLDIDVLHRPNVLADAARLPFSSSSFDTVLCDPPYNGVFQWNHDMLSELSRVSRKRIIFQHWFIPANRRGMYKKANAFILTDLYNWTPQTYFGRVQAISVFDRS